jgi:hypothetical protein
MRGNPGARWGAVLIPALLASGAARAATPVDLAGIGAGEPTAPPAPAPPGPADSQPAPPPAFAALLDVGDEHTAHWALAARAAVKVSVDHDGWYEIGQPALLAAGLAPDLDPRRLALFAEGRPVPILVRGEGDGVLDAGDAVAFHGRGLNAPSADARTYWLVTTERPAPRVTWAPPAEAGAAIDWFAGAVEWRPREVYAAALFNGDESNLFGPPVGDQPVTRRLRARHARASGEPAWLEVGVQGVSEGAHEVGIWAGGARVGALALSGWERRSARLPLAVVGDEVEISLRALGGAGDRTLVDFVRLDYPRALVVDGGALAFSADAGARLAVAGFAAHDAVQVIDVTDELGAALVAAGPADRDGIVRFTAPGPGPRRLLALASDRRNPPRAVVPNRPSRWNASQRGGDLLVIGPPPLLAAMEPWRRVREGQGWTVALVEIEDVYDEFSFGAKHPGAIRSFIARAGRVWARPPRAVLLVGDATLDPRNQLGRGDFDLVPTRLLDTYPIETASDDWFTDLDGDHIADVPVGRLPVRTPGELTIVLGKLLAAPSFSSVERAAAAGPLVFVMDRNDQIYDFQAGSAAVRAVAPPPFRTIAIDRNAEVDPLARLREAMLLQPLLVGYAGHGTQDGWGGNWLSAKAVTGLEGSGPGAFWSELTCLNGFFQDVYNPSLAEALLLRPTGGAFGIWASSGLTDLEDQLPMGRAFLDNLMVRGMMVGEAARLAKAHSSSPDVRKTWILFGDPTWRLLMPAATSPDAGSAPPGPGPDAGAAPSSPDAGPLAGDAGPAISPATGCSCRAGGAGDGGLLIFSFAVWLAWRWQRHSRRATSSTK